MNVKNISETNVKITARGIRLILRSYTSKLAFSEYIWNGFDATATTIKINYKANNLGFLEFLEIVDNGYGIDFQKLSEKFNPFYDSEKKIELNNPKHTSAMHGKNGVGRLTFFTFANTAEWITTFKRGDIFLSGQIKINADSLNQYTDTLLTKAIGKMAGTTVRFTNFKISEENLIHDIFPYIVNEFCWFLELNKEKKIEILVNDQPLNHRRNIVVEIPMILIENEIKFEIRYIQWQDILHQEFSKIYFLNSEGNEVYKDFTTLNNKGDQFYNSIYIKSKFFDDFDFKTDESSKQAKLYSKSKSSPEYKFLILKINEFLKAQRKPYLKQYATKLVEIYEKEGVLPTYTNEWEEKFRKPQLEETLIGLYEAQPKIFTSLNLDQKKTFVRLIDLLLDSNERDSLIKIVEEVVDLDTEERNDLVKLFKTTNLSRVIGCIKLIEDRYKTFYQLSALVFNEDLKADEVHHLQKLIESHYWFFGEQYHLVTAAEPKFDEALKRYHYLLYAEDVDKKIDHPNKYKEMDIFACRQNTLVNTIENIVIELKHPKIKLGRNQFIQVDKYLETILSEPLFNAPNMSWEFYLIGNEYDTSGFIERLKESNLGHGLKSLIHWHENGRIKVFAKTWSEIFAEFEIKHKYIDAKLKLEREMLTNELVTANAIIKKVQTNTAVSPKEFIIPS